MVTLHVLLACGALPRPIRGEPKVTVTEGGPRSNREKKSWHMKPIEREDEEW